MAPEALVVPAIYMLFMWMVNMRRIAYKIADNTRVADSLPSGWITEWTYEDVQPEGSLKEEDGWLFVNENQFEAIKQAANSESKMEQFKLQQKQQIDLEMQKLQALVDEKAAEEAALKAEFEQFKLWKQSNG